MTTTKKNANSCDAVDFFFLIEINFLCGEVKEDKCCFRQQVGDRKFRNNFFVQEWKVFFLFLFLSFLVLFYWCLLLISTRFCHNSPLAKCELFLQIMQMLNWFINDSMRLLYFSCVSLFIFFLFWIIWFENCFMSTITVACFSLTYLHYACVVVVFFLCVLFSVWCFVHFLSISVWPNEWCMQQHKNGYGNATTEKHITICKLSCVVKGKLVLRDNNNKNDEDDSSSSSNSRQQ